MSCRETVVLQLCPPQSAVSLRVRPKEVSRRLFGRALSQPHAASGANIDDTFPQDDRLAFLEEKVNLLLSGSR